mgnify:CR=1 FL=1
MVTAFAPNKKVDLAIEAFNISGKSLKIVGSGQRERELRAKANKNIEFLGNLSRSEVIKSFSKAKAFVFPGVEDFGITPLESLACGTPVIAYKIGGVLETLNEHVAEYFEEASAVCLNQAIERFEGKNFEQEVLLNRATSFSKDLFIKKIGKIISDTL